MRHASLDAVGTPLLAPALRENADTESRATVVSPHAICPPPQRMLRRGDDGDTQHSAGKSCLPLARKVEATEADSGVDRCEAGYQQSVETSRYA